MHEAPHFIIEPRQVMVPLAEPSTAAQDWKKTAAFLITRGFTQADIAIAVDRSPETVGQLLGTESFRKLVEDAANKTGSVKSTSTSLLTTAASSAAQTIINLARTSNSDAVRLRAAQDILDRTQGRAIQTVYTQKASCDLDPSAEAKQLKDEIRRQLKHLGPNITLQIASNGHTSR